MALPPDRLPNSSNPLSDFIVKSDPNKQFANDLQNEGYIIDEISDDLMLFQMRGQLPATREGFYFRGKRSTLRLDIGVVDTNITGRQKRDWVMWSKQKFLDQHGEAQDNFNLEEESIEIDELAPQRISFIFRQLVSEYRQETSIEGNIQIPTLQLDDK